MDAKPTKTLTEKLQSLNRHVLYLTLFVAISLSLVVSHLLNIKVPAQPQQCTIDAYKILRNIPEGQTVVIDTGFTNSSRGENGGEIEAVLRMLMREKVKFVLYSWVEPQCVEIAKTTIDKINEERRNSTPPQPEYKEWQDYVILGFFPDGTTMLQTVASNVREAWGARQAKDLTGHDRGVFESPVLSNIHRVQDFPAYVTIAPSGTMPTIVARVGRLVPVISMITGVMFPEQYNYYKSGQLKGLINGLVGTVEFETLMDKGIDSAGVPGGNAPGTPEAAGFSGQKNFARAADYYFAFCCAMTLLLLVIAVGNIGMFLDRRGGKR